MNLQNHDRGFTFLELCVTLSIIGVLVSIAIPSYSSQIENIQLRRAARDLYTNMQLAKIEAIKDNINHRIVFDPRTGQQGYAIWSEGPNGIWDNQDGDDILEKSIRLADYGKTISYGKGDAWFGATVTQSPIPANGVSYQDLEALFQPIGTIGKHGYVYFRNQKGANYAVGTPVFAGVIVMKKWKAVKWE